MVKRMAATLATITMAGALGAASAHASQSVGEHTAVHTAAVVKAEDPPAGYTFEGNFYWHASCEEAGKGGIPRAWSAYVCLGDGMPWDSYNLYVKYN
ncbi:MAG: hypothetical protein HOW97_11525 [Catenulispora sp.]|nr:hypothetical protein [Catenulispora sp.]